MHDRIRTAMIGGGLSSAVGRAHEIAMKMDKRLQRMAGCFSRNADINASGDKLRIDRISTNSAITTDSRYKRFKAGRPSGFTEAFPNYYGDIADAMQAACLNEYTLSTAVAVDGIAVCHATQQSSLTGRSGPLAEVHAGH